MKGLKEELAGGGEGGGISRYKQRRGMTYEENPETFQEVILLGSQKIDKRPNIEKKRVA